jgi:hypothetical protein
MSSRRLFLPVYSKTTTLTIDALFQNKPQWLLCLSERLSRLNISKTPGSRYYELKACMVECMCVRQGIRGHKYPSFPLAGVLLLSFSKTSLHTCDVVRRPSTSASFRSRRHLVSWLPGKQTTRSTHDCSAASEVTWKCTSGIERYVLPFQNPWHLRWCFGVLRFSVGI